MARISSYIQDTDVNKSDKLLGADASGATRNFDLASISDFFKETNSAGVAGQFTYKLAYGADLDPGEMDATISSGMTFANVTAVKVSKFIYKETTNSIESALSLLNGRDVLITQVDNHNNYGIYSSGTVTQIGDDSNIYDLTLTKKSSNGSLVNGNIYAICIYASPDVNYIHTQSSASTTWTINHNLGKFPSVSIKFSTGADFNNTGALGGVTYTNENTLTINLAAAESGVAYLN